MSALSGDGDTVIELLFVYSLQGFKIFDTLLCIEISCLKQVT